MSVYIESVLQYEDVRLLMEGAAESGVVRRTQLTELIETHELGALGDRERQVIILRYGLGDHEPKTLEEIGRRLGLTRERVRQIELDSLRRLSTLREMQAVSVLKEGGGQGKNPPP